MVGPCVVAFCKNIGSHLFPKEESRRKQWIEAIKHMKPGLSVKKYSLVCSAHFKPTDFSTTPMACQRPGQAPKILKKTAVPSIFPWNKGGTIDGAPYTKENILAAPSTSKINLNNTDADEPMPRKPSPETESLILNVNRNNNQKTYSRAPPIAFVEEPIFFQPDEAVTQHNPLKSSDGDSSINIGEYSALERDNDGNTSEYSAFDESTIIEVEFGGPQENEGEHRGQKDAAVQTEEHKGRCEVCGCSPQERERALQFHNK